jgi:DNA integrity scanning protein DisA with diadenylate cyclase activity
MKINLSELPDREKMIYQQITKLTKNEKQLLWHLIKNTNIEGITLYPKIENEMKSLIKHEFIAINEIYRGEGYSFFILQRAPYLLRQLKKLVLH